MDTLIIAFIGVFLGVFIRTVFPAIRKWYEATQDPDKVFDWNHLYTKTALFSLFVSAIATLLGWQAFAIPDTEWYMILTTSLVYGFGLNSIVVEVLAWT